MVSGAGCCRLHAHSGFKTGGPERPNIGDARVCHKDEVIQLCSGGDPGRGRGIRRCNHDWRPIRDAPRNISEFACRESGAFVSDLWSAYGFADRIHLCACPVRLGAKCDDIASVSDQENCCSLRISCRCILSGTFRRQRSDRARIHNGCSDVGCRPSGSPRINFAGRGNGCDHCAAMAARGAYRAGVSDVFCRDDGAGCGLWRIAPL